MDVDLAYRLVIFGVVTVLALALAGFILALYRGEHIPNDLRQAYRTATCL